MKKILPGVIAALALAASPCIADYYDDAAEEETYRESTAKEKGIYAFVSGGAADMNEISVLATSKTFKVGKGGTFEGGIGYRFNENLRLEASYGQSKVDVDKDARTCTASTGDVPNCLFSETTIQNVFVSGFFDLENDSRFTPYLGVGVGTAKLEVDANDIQDTDRQTTYQAKGGVTFDAADRVDLFADLTYQVIDDSNLAVTDIEAMKLWKGQVGVRFFF